MKIHRALGLCALVFPAVLGAACRSKGSVVRIAVAVPLTGDMGTEGQGLRRAVELAVEEADEAKRLPFRLEVRALDDRADPKEAVNVANLIVSDPRVAAVIGHYNSGCAIPAARVYAKAGLPMLVPSASNPRVTQQQSEPDWGPVKNIFRVCPTDDVEGAYVGEFIYSKLGVKRLAVVQDKTSYGQSLAERVRERFSAAGGQVVSFDAISAGDKNFNALITRIKEERPGGLYFGGYYTEAGLLLKQMKEHGLSVPFVSGDASKTEGLFAIAGAAADGAYLGMIGVPVEFLPSAKDFVEKYKARYKSPGAEIKPFDHFAYEAAQIVIDALGKVGPDRAKLLEEIRSTDRDGVIGHTRFDGSGDTLNKTITITRADWKTRSFLPLK